MRYVCIMKPVPTWFIASCWVMAVLFCVCVGLQYNDPDPLRWMGMYGAAAIACAVLPARRMFIAAAIVVALVAAVWGAYLGHQIKDVLAFSDLWTRMSEKGGAVEIGREAGGLAIVAITLFIASALRAMRA